MSARAPGSTAVPAIQSTTHPTGPVPISRPSARSARSRSEEHTSELQSRLHLVCRLLLEKKKKTLPHQFETGREPTTSYDLYLARAVSVHFQSPFVAALNLVRSDYIIVRIARRTYSPMSY